MDYHTNTIRITFMAFIIGPILGWIPFDSMQKGQDVFNSILLLRMVWCSVVVGFLVFFEIGIRYVGNLHEAQQDMNYLDDELSYLKNQGVRRLNSQPGLLPW